MQLASGIATAQVENLLQKEQQELSICGCKFNTLNKRPIRKLPKVASQKFAWHDFWSVLTNSPHIVRVRPLNGWEL